MVRDLGNEILHRYGYHVISASDGEEALAIWAIRDERSPW